MAKKRNLKELTADGVDESDTMAAPTPRTRSVRTIIDEEQPVEGDARLVSAEDVGDEEINPVDELLAELGDGANFDIAVFRMDKTKPNGRVFVGPLPAGGMNNSSMLCTRLQQEYGGGDFYLQVKNPEDHRFIRRIVVSIEAPRQPPTPPAAQMQESIIGALSPILTKLVEAQQRPAINLDTITNAALKLAPLLGLVQGFLRPQQGSAFDLEKYLEMKTKLDALGMGDSEPSAAMQAMTLFKEFGKPMLDAIQNAQHNPGAVRVTPSPRLSAAPGAGAVPPSVPAPGMGFPTMGAMTPAPRVNGKATSTDGNLRAMLAPFVPVIAQFAHAGMSPEDAALKFLDALPDDYVDPLADAIESGELTGILTANKELSGYTVWVEKIGELILAELGSADDGSDAENDEGATATH